MTGKILTRYELLDLEKAKKKRKELIIVGNW